VERYVVAADEELDLDPFCAALKDHADFKLLRLSTFLSLAGIAFEDRVGYLKPNPHGAVQLEQMVVYDRVIDARSQTLLNLDPQGRLTSNLLLWEYDKALRQCQTVFGDIRSSSAAGSVLPLNMQWRLMQSKANWSVPRFHYALGREEPRIEGFERPIWTSPTNLYKWKPTPRPTESPLHAFVIDRPKGTPVLVYFVGDESRLYALDGSKIPESVRAGFQELALVLRNAFRAFTGEALFFVDNEDVVFGSFSHRLTTAGSDPHFANFVRNSLLPA
jgi:hypothetical protein